MKITVPKTSGFCYGVSLAVKEAESVLKAGKSLIMYGEIVHNPDVVSDLERKGGRTVEELEQIGKDEALDDTVLLIRAHGVSKQTHKKLVGTGAEVRDKTCPKVKKVQEIVSEEEKKGRQIVIVGNPHHPEVIGILGQCEKEGATVIGSVFEAEEARLTGDISVVVQTTFNGEVFERIKNILVEKYPQAVIFNTMCPATNIRQQEIQSLSRNADYVIVLGGKKSSNSLKLCEIAGKNAPSELVEKIGEIDLEKLRGKNNIVVCGGSSTPYELIRDAAEYISGYFSCEIQYL